MKMFNKIMEGLRELLAEELSVDSAFLVASGLSNAIVLAPSHKALDELSALLESAKEINAHDERSVEALETWKRIIERNGRMLLNERLQISGLN